MVHNTYPTLKPRLVAHPTLKPRLVEHTHTDGFFGGDVSIRNSLRSNNATLYAPRYEVAFFGLQATNDLGRYAPSTLPHY